MRAVVTGCGHCGTWWFTRLCQQLGLSATHEGIYNWLPDELRWAWPEGLHVECSLAAPPWFKEVDRILWLSRDFATLVDSWTHSMRFSNEDSGGSRWGFKTGWFPFWAFHCGLTWRRDEEELARQYVEKWSQMGLRSILSAEKPWKAVRVEELWASPQRTTETLEWLTGWEFSVAHVADVMHELGVVNSHANHREGKPQLSEEGTT